MTALRDTKLNDWCLLQEPLVGLLTGEPAPAPSKPPKEPRHVSLEEVLTKKQPLTLGTALKVWGGLLLVLDRIHHSGPDETRLLLYANLRHWCLALPTG